MVLKIWRSDHGIAILTFLSGVLLGHAERELGLWRLRDWTPVPGVDLRGHTGWVRTLAVSNQLMISAACNFIKVWELPVTSDAMTTKSSTIKHLGDLELFKGDVLVSAMDDDCVYAATADGMLHVWTISQAIKNLSVSSTHRRGSVQAHKGRIISLVLHHGVVITAGHDGHIRVWCKSTLQMKAEAVAAHEGSKLHSLASTSAFLFSGGADKFVRVWDPATLTPIGHPVQAHAKGVRSLAATTSASMSLFETECQLHSLNSTVWVVSGDAHGEIILWRFIRK
ncbi:hypothetical protein M758_4G271600 [Ceratodon purpureus]|nr:hypothetical protein M758_4G271600 [Ceratodon purpureus]